MRIAFIGQKGIPGKGGGIEKYAEDLSVPMAKSGHEVYVYTRPYYTRKELTQYQGVKLLSVPTIKTKHLDAITHSLLCSFDVLRRDVDIAHYQNIGPALACFIPKLFGRKIKVVSTLQSKDYEHKKWGLFAKTMLHLGELMLCLFSDEVITVSNDIYEYAKKKYGIQPHLITNGIRINEKKNADKIKAWGLEQGNYIVAINRLVRHKGIQYLIEAYNNMKTDKKLVIVGEGAFTDDYVKEIKEMASDNRNIIFTGNQTGDVLAELYSNSYLFVQPSEAEGLSLALLEAMSYKIPVLVSDIPGNLEAVGGAGLVFRNKDVADLSSKLDYALTNSETMEIKGEEGFERVKKYFHSDKIAAEILEVYKKEKVKKSKISILLKAYANIFSKGNAALNR